MIMKWLAAYSPGHGNMTVFHTGSGVFARLNHTRNALRERRLCPYGPCTTTRSETGTRRALERISPIISERTFQVASWGWPIPMA